MEYTTQSGSVTKNIIIPGIFPVLVFLGIVFNLQKHCKMYESGCTSPAVNTVYSYDIVNISI